MKVPSKETRFVYENVDIEGIVAQLKNLKEEVFGKEAPKGCKNKAKLKERLLPLVDKILQLHVLLSTTLAATSGPLTSPTRCPLDFSCRSSLYVEGWISSLVKLQTYVVEQMRAGRTDVGELEPFFTKLAIVGEKLVEFCEWFITALTVTYR